MSNRNYIVICLLLLFSISVLPQPHLAQKKPVAKPGSFVAVKRFVGKIANDKVIANIAVKKELIAIMGSRRYRLLDHYTTVQSGVDLISGDVVASGCAPHECMDKSAIVVVDVDGRKVHAAIYDNETLTIYSREKTFDYLPNGLTDWARLLIQKQAEDGVRVRIVQA